MARRLAPLVDPEDGDAASALPAAIALGDLEPFDSHLDPDAAVASVVRRWRMQGDDPPLAATIGVSADGVVGVDLARDGPHGLIAGTTGSGKSELLRTLVIALAVNVSPDHLAFVLVDFKGGSTFDVCARLPHTVGIVTDLDDGLAARALVSLEAEVRRREHLLRDVGVADLTEYRRRAGTDPLPRLVVVIDEFASMAAGIPRHARRARRGGPAGAQPRPAPAAGDATSGRCGHRRDPSEHESAARVASERCCRRR